MNKIIKNNFLLFIIFIFKYIKLFSPLILVLIIGFNNYKIISLICLILSCFTILIYSLMKWYNISFALDKKSVKYNLGIFFKQQINIPLNNLTTIKIEQNLIQKIFNICNFKIRDGNLNKKKIEIKMILKKEEAFYLEKLIKINQDKLINKNIIKKQNNEKFIFKVKPKELVLFALTGNNITYGIGFVFATKGFLTKLKKYVDFNIINTIHPVLDLKVMYKTYGMYIIYIMLVMLIIFFIISTIIAIIQKFIKFYDFRIYKNETNLIIKYGLISKKSYTISIKNIIAVKLNQNFIKQVFDLYKLNVCLIGYGQEKNEEAILYPIVNSRSAIKILTTLLPEFSDKIEIFKAPKKSLYKFMILPVSTFLFMYFFLIYLNSQFIVLIVLLPILIVSRYLNYKNVGIGFDDNIFIGINKGFFKNILILKNFKIQSLEKKSTYFQRRKQLCTYKINYANGSILLKHLDESIFKKIKNIL